MRELTFKGFLAQYVRDLSEQESNSLYKLAAEAGDRNVRLQEKYGVTNHRIYTDLKLNPGNLNAWLKHGNGDKVSLDTARKVVRYFDTMFQ